MADLEPQYKRPRLDNEPQHETQDAHTIHTKSQNQQPLTSQDPRNSVEIGVHRMEESSEEDDDVEEEEVDEDEQEGMFMEWLNEQRVQGTDPRDILTQMFNLSRSSVESIETDQSCWMVITQLLDRRFRPAPRPRTPITTIEEIVETVAKAKNILVLTGAGVSTSCGIPDFRSANGVYARLKTDYPTLPNPQAMFSMDYFLRDPKPFFDFAREIYPGNFKPAPSHRFIQQLEAHGKLMRNYTQNIDTLEQVAGITKVIQCHGSFNTASCLICKHSVSGKAIEKQVMAKEVPLCPNCHPGNETSEDHSNSTAAITPTTSETKPPTPSIKPSMPPRQTPSMMPIRTTQTPTPTTQAELLQANDTSEDTAQQPTTTVDTEDVISIPSNTNPNTNRNTNTTRGTYVDVDTTAAITHTTTKPISRSPNHINHINHTTHTTHTTDTNHTNNTVDGKPSSISTTSAISDTANGVTSNNDDSTNYIGGRDDGHNDYQPQKIEMQPVLKPDIVFFGQDLPKEFYDSLETDCDVCDLVIVIGSSLKVSPVAGIPEMIPHHIPQILINREPLPHKRFNAELLGNCDGILQELARHLGWKLDDEVSGAGPDVTASSESDSTSTSTTTSTSSTLPTSSSATLPTATSMADTPTTTTVTPTQTSQPSQPLHTSLSSLSSTDSATAMSKPSSLFSTTEATSVVMSTTDSQHIKAISPTTTTTTTTLATTTTTATTSTTAAKTPASSTSASSPSSSPTSTTTTKTAQTKPTTTPTTPSSLEKQQQQQQQPTEGPESRQGLTAEYAFHHPNRFAFPGAVLEFVHTDSENDDSQSDSEDDDYDKHKDTNNNDDHDDDDHDKDTDTNNDDDVKVNDVIITTTTTNDINKETVKIDPVLSASATVDTSPRDSHPHTTIKRSNGERQVQPHQEEAEIVESSTVNTNIFSHD